jgi:hypothetical protein
MLAADPARAFYGPGHVLAAAELGAIQTLLISGEWGEEGGGGGLGWAKSRRCRGRVCVVGAGT